MTWHRSSHSNPTHPDVEVATGVSTIDPRILVRNAKYGDLSPRLTFSRAAWQELVVDRIKAGVDSPCVYGPDDVQADVPEGGVAMVWSAADRTDDDMATIVFTADGWAAFTAGVKAGEFDVDRLVPR